ncbi:MAG: hypothetical protein JOZ85_15055 [Betaproteobacteria bacterium]|nr:hypothetical protein [Betaproteobacteria bacterium]
MRSLLTAMGLCLAATATAQTSKPLNLNLVPVTDGVVTSIREVHVNPDRLPPPAGTQTVGVPTDIEESPPVGAVLYKPIGAGTPKSEKTWKIGGAGTPDMQSRFAQSGYDVDVKMDDGERRTFRIPDARHLHVGQRVSLRSGTLEPAT